jgi:hypothetical protein
MEEKGRACIRENGKRESEEASAVRKDTPTGMHTNMFTFNVN